MIRKPKTHEDVIALFESVPLLDKFKQVNNEYKRGDIVRTFDGYAYTCSFESIEAITHYPTLPDRGISINLKLHCIMLIRVDFVDEWSIQWFGRSGIGGGEYDSLKIPKPELLEVQNVNP